MSFLHALLACPECHKPFQELEEDTACHACKAKVFVKDGVISTENLRNTASFDDKFEVMQENNRDRGTQWLCYTRQAKLLEEALKPGHVLLDVGCGPAISYAKRAGTFLIGLDPSYPSVRANRSVDLRLCASADRLPLKNQSVDAIACLYSIHHMVGANTVENRDKVVRAMEEFRRVLKSGGSLFIFEVNPWYPFWLAEKLSWDAARKMLKTKLDMHFWHVEALKDLGTECLPNSEFELIQFKTGPLVTFPPLFTTPWLKVPRMLFPFDTNCLRWRMK